MQAAACFSVASVLLFGVGIGSSKGRAQDTNTAPNRRLEIGPRQ